MKLAIIILSGDTPEILFKCLRGIKENVLVEYKIYIGYNGKSTEVEEEIRAFFKNNFSPEAYKIIKYDFYNFAILNNDIVRSHLDPDAEYLLFCNNDVIISGECVNEMVHCMYSAPRALGTVGCRLLFENGTIQHDGQVVFVWNNSLFRGISHLNIGKSPAEHHSPKPRLVLGNTFALCLSTRKVFDVVGGLNESYSRCFEDVEYNLRCLQFGFSNIILPTRHWAFHLESYTRKTHQADALIDSVDYERLRCFFNEQFMHGKELLIQTGEMPAENAASAR